MSIMPAARPCAASVARASAASATCLASGDAAAARTATLAKSARNFPVLASCPGTDASADCGAAPLVALRSAELRAAVLALARATGFLARVALGFALDFVFLAINFSPYFLRSALCGLRLPMRPLSLPAEGSITALM